MYQLNKQLLVKRWLKLSPDISEDDIKTIVQLLRDVPAVHAVSNDTINTKLLIEYDQLQQSYGDLLMKLNEQEINIPRTLYFKLLSGWYDYLDSTAKENAEAPPPTCCNKPPKR